MTCTAITAYVPSPTAVRFAYNQRKHICVLGVTTLAVHADRHKSVVDEYPAHPEIIKLLLQVMLQTL